MLTTHTEQIQEKRINKPNYFSLGTVWAVVSIYINRKIHACMCICIYIYKHTCIYIYLGMDVYKKIVGCMHIYLCLYTQSYMNIYVYLGMNIYK